ncbi:uncharacterized protein LOC143424875 [Xylocopa sonorina]|uniref:uncharacterized protein LOC143424875 n=1 Tax=Xylocopa sonorina TaxID=1818115 RepID=UPI00403B1DC5
MEDVLIISEKLSEVVKNMQKCLQCKICLRTISDPVKTLCGHRYCHSCIQSILRNKLGQCPHCKKIIRHQNISKDKHTVVFIDQLQKLMKAVELDSDINCVSDLQLRLRPLVPKPRNRRKSSSDRKEYNESNIEEQDFAKPSCSYDNVTPAKKQTNHKRRNSLSRKESKDEKSKNKIKQKEDSNIVYLSSYGLSGIEPLDRDDSNDYTANHKVHKWLETMQENESSNTCNKVTTVESVEYNLDDTITMSVSQSCANNEAENRDEDKEIVSEAMSRNSTHCSVTKQSSREPSRDKHNENKSNDRWDCRQFFETRSAQNSTSKMNFDADNPQPSTSGATGSNNRSEKENSQVKVKKNWSTVARFGKEMRAKGKKLKSLNVSIENKRRSGSFNRSATSLEKEEVAMSKNSTKDRGKEDIRRGVRKGQKSKVLTQVSKTKECSDNEFSEQTENLTEVKDGLTKELSNKEDKLIAEEIQPVCESSFVTLTDGEQVRIRNLNSCQMNAIIGVANEDRRAEIEQDTTNNNGTTIIPTKKHVHPTSTSSDNRIKILSQVTSAGSAEIRNQVNLVNISNDEADNTSPSLMQGIELMDELYSMPRLQASTPIDNRLSLNKQAIRRDSNRQIDQSNGNTDADSNSRGRTIETEKNRSFDNEKHDNELVRDSSSVSNRRRDDVGHNSSLVMFKKLGKVYKYRKKRVSFLYLGTTRQEKSSGSSYCDLRLQKPYSLVDILSTQDSENVSASESGFGNNALITVNETPIIEQDEVQNVRAKEVESVEKTKTVPIVKDAFTNRYDAPKQCTFEQIAPVRDTVCNSPYKAESTDVVLLTLDENEGTVQPCVEHSTTLFKDTFPTKNFYQQSLESSSIDTLATQIFVHESERSKDKLLNDPSKILARTSKDACSADSSCTSTKRKQSNTKEKSTTRIKTGFENESDEERYASDHSFTSQATRVTTPSKKVSHLKKKSSNGKSTSSIPSTRDIETMCLSSDSDNREGSTNDKLNVSLKSKRKRAASFDSSDEEDLREIVSKWCETGKNGTRCKKKGKSEQERGSTDSRNASSKGRTNISFTSRLSGNKFAGNRGTEKSNLNGIESNTGTNNRQTITVNEDSPDFGLTINNAKDISNRETISEEWLAKRANLMEDNFDDIIANVDTTDLANNYNRDNTCKPTSDKVEFFDDNCERKYNQGSSSTLYFNSSDKENRCSVPRALHDSDSNADKTLVPEHANVTRKSLKKDKFQEEIKAVDSTSKGTIPPNGATRILVNQIEPTVKHMYEQDSLMNITEDSLMLKQFEQDLFGKPICHGKEQRTPKRLKKDKRSNDKNIQEAEDSSEEDDIIENTPDTKTKTRQATNSSRESSTPFSKITGKSASLKTPSSTSGRSSSNVSSPICRRKLLHPLCQSTPKTHQSSIKSNYDPTKFTFSNEQTSTPKRAPQTARNGQAVNNQSLCFVCSGLVSSQVEQVNRLARMVNARYVTQFELEVTHVIVKTNSNNNGAEKTLKYLQGIVHKKWIMSYKWVLDSLKEGRLVDEIPYEAVDSKTLEAGPRKSRLGEKDLFAGFAFLCIGPYPDISLEQYQNLLRATGAIVVDNLNSLAAERTQLKIIVIQSDIYECEIIEWYKKTRAVPIFYDWVVECISQYKLTSFYPYLQELSQQDVRKLGFPEYLVEEVHDEDSDTMYEASM